MLRVLISIGIIALGFLMIPVVSASLNGKIRRKIRMLGDLLDDGKINGSWPRKGGRTR